MKKTNKIVSFVLAVILIVSVVPVTASAMETGGECGDSVTWSYDGATKTLTISGTGEMYDCSCNGLLGPVWWNNYHEKITAVYVEEGVTYIGKYAFAYLGNLTKVSLPDSLTEIGDMAFKESKRLINITIPKGVSSIGLNSFQGCYNLEFIEVDNDNLHYSNDEYGVLFNKDKTEIVGFPMNNVQTHYNVPSSVEIIGMRAFACNRRLLSVTLGEDVKEIGVAAFWACENLRAIDIPDKITVIQAYAFSECKMLTNVKLGDSVKTIGTGAFESCSRLESVDFNDDLITICNYAFEGCGRLKSITIPDSVTTIGSRSFGKCGLQNINFGNGVTTIECEAFYKCRNLTTLTFPDSVKVIGDNAFYQCYKLTNVKFGEGVETIGSQAFYLCNTLPTVTIPANVKNISPSAFCSCTSLTSIIVDSENKYYSSDEYGVLYNKDKTILVIYPKGSKMKEYIIPDGVTTIEAYAFEKVDFYSGYYSLDQLTIPDSVTTIGIGAFYECTHYLSRVNYMGSKKQWESVAIESQNQTLQDIIHFEHGIIKGAYENIDWELDIDNGVLTFSGSGVLSHSCLSSYMPMDLYDSEIKRIVINDGITSISGATFYAYKNLLSVTISDSVEKIGNRNFCYCENLLSVYYTGTEEQWKEISIGQNNQPLLDATIYYNCCIHEREPTQTIPATCTTHGSTKYTCKKCNSYCYDYTSNPTGHTFNEDGVCETCGEKEVSTNHVNTQMLSIESVLAMVMSLLSKIFGMFAVA